MASACGHFILFCPFLGICLGDETAGPVRGFGNLLGTIFDHAEEHELLSETASSGMLMLGGFFSVICV